MAIKTSKVTKRPPAVNALKSLMGVIRQLQPPAATVSDSKCADVAARVNAAVKLNLRWPRLQQSCPLRNQLYLVQRGRRRLPYIHRGSALCTVKAKRSP